MQNKPNTFLCDPAVLDCRKLFLSYILLSVRPQGLVAIFLSVTFFHIIYDYTIKGAIDEKIKF